MPFVAEEQPRALHTGKKRRWDDDRDVLQSSYAKQNSCAVQHGEDFELTGCTDRHLQHQQYQQHGLLDYDKLLSHGDGIVHLTDLPRKAVPLQLIKRPRYLDEESTSRLSSSPRSRKHARSPSNSHSTDTASRPQPGRANSGLLLQPCHICHRRPTKKSDLDSYAECEGCRSRTCFVCIRQCQGWISEHQNDAIPTTAHLDDDEDYDISEQEALSRSFHMNDADDEVRDDNNSSSHHALTRERKTHANGHGDRRGASSARDAGRDENHIGWTSQGHQQVVCSRCCIEKGPEGDIVCLGCLSQMREG